MSNIETYKGIYAMHKYWGKKPFNEISKFIENYSKPNDVVLDCFCGSGVTLIESLKAGRNCIGVDINPLAIKLSKISLTPVDLKVLQTTFKKIENSLKVQINSLYEVDEKDELTLVTHTIWKDGVPIEVWYKDNSNKKVIREGRNIDIDMANEPSIKPKWYPTSPMYENSRINVKENQNISDLFTKRAIVGLSLLLDEIKKIEDEKIRDVFELTLSGTLSQASKLVFVIRDRKKNGVISDKAEVGSWVVGYWVPAEHFEINVWNCFENRYKRILKGVKEINEIFANAESGLANKSFELFNTSSTELPLNDNCVDYIFIDPPHSNRVLYMEMSLMWNAWLGLDSELDWDNEIVVSEAKYRNKSKENFNELLGIVFKEVRRVLKKDKYFSFAFNCLDDDTWLNTLNLFVNNGFEVEDIVPLNYSATSVMQDNRKNALKTDFVLTFKNSKNDALKSIVYEADIIELREKIKKIKLENSSIESFQVMNLLFAETIPKGYIYKVSQIMKISAEVS